MPMVRSPKSRSQRQKDRINFLSLVAAVLVLAGALWWALTTEGGHTPATPPATAQAETDSPRSADRVLGKTKIH